MSTEEHQESQESISMIRQKTKSDNPPAGFIGTTTSNIRDTAIEAVNFGLSVYPPTEDGEKKPDGLWKKNQSIRANLDQIQRWYGTTGPPERTGLGIICGAVSGNIEAFEFDAFGRLYGPFREAAEALGLGELVERHLRRLRGGIAIGRDSLVLPLFDDRGQHATRPLPFR
jgi:hypothetical protein